MRGIICGILGIICIIYMILYDLYDLLTLMSFRIYYYIKLPYNTELKIRKSKTFLLTFRIAKQFRINEECNITSIKKITFLNPYLKVIQKV